MMTSAVKAKVQILSGIVDGKTVKYPIVTIPNDDLERLVDDNLTESVAGTKRLKTKGSTLNIIMIDVSGSMSSVFPIIKAEWNNQISNKLDGETKLYTFGADIKFRRKEPIIETSDNDCSCTNLTGALRTIKQEVESSSNSHVRIFLMTDGQHNVMSEPDPLDVIQSMHAPTHKLVEVFLLGIGYEFPVNYSIDIRSHLHNGNANCPTIFWSKEKKEIPGVLAQILEEMQKSTVKLDLSLPAHTLPFVDDTKNHAFMEENLLYDVEFEHIKKSLEIKTTHGTVIPITEKPTDASISFLVNSLFPQWNAILIQRHRNKLPVPMKVFDLMESSFKIEYEKLQSGKSSDDSIRTRLLKKDSKTLETRFRTLMNEGFKLISVESKFMSERAMAESILKTTVQSKFDTKLLELRGHGETEWKKDSNEFKRVYQSLKEQISAFPDPSPEDCCRVLLCSFVSDLKDPEFESVLDVDKMEFLRCVSITGIPVFAPVKGYSQINPWTINIKSICTSPFEIVSQRAMESSLSVTEGTQPASEDKEVVLQADNPNSKFNVIVPIIPKEACNILQPLVNTNVFSVAATFCILKNPLVIDHNCHIAALACVWLKSITDYPPNNRPDFVKNRIADVESTANMYMDRSGLKNYTDALLNNPALAMMTESGEKTHNNASLKCESLVKPAFLLHLCREKLTLAVFKTVMQYLITEFLGRCIDFNNPYLQLEFFFTHEEVKEILKKLTEDALGGLELEGDSLLKKCYALYEVELLIKKAFKLTSVEDKKKDSMDVEPTETDAKDDEMEVEDSFKFDTKIEDIKPNMKKVEAQSNKGSAGNVTLKVLKALAVDLNHSCGFSLTEEELEQQLFSPDMITVYLQQAFTHIKSAERFSTSFLTPLEAKTKVHNRISRQLPFYFKKKVLPDINKDAVRLWRESYTACHKHLAEPLTREQMIAEAQQKGINVTEETFNKVYRYKPTTGLSRNCCQVRQCPHFLVPSRHFNCHLEEERKSITNYPHTLHLVTSSDKNRESCMSTITSGTAAGTKSRKHPPVPSNEAPLSDFIDNLLQKYLLIQTAGMAVN